MRELGRRPYGTTMITALASNASGSAVTGKWRFIWCKILVQIATWAPWRRPAHQIATREAVANCRAFWSASASPSHSIPQCFR